jgi:primase-polymerase (primpol)-like protein
MQFDAIHQPISPASFDGVLQAEQFASAERLANAGETIRAAAVAHGADAKGRHFRLLTKAEAEAVAVEEERERLRSHIAALREEMRGLDARNWHATQRNLQLFPNQPKEPLTDPEELHQQIAFYVDQLEALEEPA